LDVFIFGRLSARTSFNLLQQNPCGAKLSPFRTKNKAAAKTFSEFRCMFILGILKQEILQFS